MWITVHERDLSAARANGTELPSTGIGVRAIYSHKSQATKPSKEKLPLRHPAVVWYHPEKSSYCIDTRQ